MALIRCQRCEMKKITSIICIITSVILLCSCSGGIKAEIVSPSGTKSEITSQELMDLCNTNEKKYDDEYDMATATVTSEVTNIEKKIEYDTTSGEYIDYYDVQLEDNWVVEVGENVDIMDRIDIGTKIKVKAARFFVYRDCTSIILSSASYDHNLIDIEIVQ
ncbi:MAG: hypothetical protein PHW34_07725 [Hespellia sp.]|nr:hypothetical protein [Hespellia sp.]